MDLSSLDREALTELAREREVAFQDVLAEIVRREPRASDWSETDAAAQMAIYRAGGKTQLHKIEVMPPALFRMGYEWCALSLTRMLDGVLSHASNDALMVQDFRHERNGLYRPTGEQRVSDPRRRAALDLIQMVETFLQNRIAFLFSHTLPVRQSAYDPDRDQDELKDHGPGIGKPSSGALGIR